MYEMENGLRQVRVGADPSTVQVCMTCLDMDSKVFSMGKYNLEKTYENLTGHSLCDMGNLKQTLCIECTQRLINFRRFRDKSLRAHNLMLDLINKHQSVTKQHIKSIDRVKNQLVSNITQITLEPDRYNSYGLERMDEYKDAEIDLLVDTENIIVKNEIKDESTSVNEDNNVDIKFEVDIDENHYNDDFLLPYDNDISDENIMQDTKLMNHDQCNAVLKKISNFENQKLAYECVKCFKNFSTEAELNVHQTIHSKPQRRPPPAPTPATRATHTDGLTSTKERIRSSSADCELALATPLSARLATIDKVETHPDRFEADTFGDSIKVFVIDSDELDVKPSDNNNKAKCTHDISDKTSKQDEFMKRTVNSSKLFTRNNDTVLQTHEHIKTHIKVKPFSCKICHYECEKKYLLKRHTRIHTGDKPFACNLCKYKCSRKDKLVVHMRIHTGEKPFACKLCNYKCSRKDYLVLHMRIHNGEKRFACKLCKYKCSRKSYLVSHMKTHTGEKPFDCNICHYKCSKKSQLVCHLGTHTGQKLFTCEICRYECAWKSHLEQHMRTHTGEKLFACNLCKYKCLRKENLVVHMRIHTGERFACTLCDYKCSRKDNLMLHVKIHAGKKLFGCKL